MNYVWKFCEMKDGGLDLSLMQRYGKEPVILSIEMA
jgi:hypothetical protein